LNAETKHQTPRLSIKISTLPDPGFTGGTVDHRDSSGPYGNFHVTTSILNNAR